MHLEEAKIGTKGGLHLGRIKDYLEVIKPRETGLLVFIGVISAFVAKGGLVPVDRFLYILVSLLTASAGANGLTNYLDRELDANMERTRRRALPSHRIQPAERALVFTAFLSAAGLISAWYLHPLAFLADLVGTAAAMIYRKKVTCVFPQGMIASCAPVLMGWFAIRPSVNWEILFLCILIAVWLPSHIWSIMIAYKEDYWKAGLTYFPLNCDVKTVSKILFAFCLVLFAASISLYFIGHFGWLYLAAASAAGLSISYASLRLMLSNMKGSAWKLYKLSAFPYLGFIFLAMGLDVCLAQLPIFWR